MPQNRWSLLHDRPVIKVVLTLAQGGAKVTRNLLADTGAGSLQAPFEILLEESDCLLCDGTLNQTVTLGGAYADSYPVYLIRVEIPSLAFDHEILAVGVPSTSKRIRWHRMLPILESLRLRQLRRSREVRLGGVMHIKRDNESDKMNALRSMEWNPVNTLSNIQQLNCNLAEQINADALRDPHSPFAGKKVGIANGQVVHEIWGGA